MSFVSIEFCVFFSIAFLVFNLIPPRARVQAGFLLVASAVFYAFWDWRFLFLMLGLSFLHYGAALAVDAARSQRNRTIWLVLAISATLMALGFFKYTNFLLGNLALASRWFGSAAGFDPLDIVLPLGISFHSFQCIAYTIDVWRKEIRAERDPVAFASFSLFFPQLVAGPIERAVDLLAQFVSPIVATRAQIERGVWLVLLGFTLKVVIGNGIAPVVDAAFSTDQRYGWSTVLGTFAFAIQIYADFHGYSLIAVGTAAMLGYRLSMNFAFPYWAISPSDFWRRWHITLSTWLRDYLYKPLGGSRRSRHRAYWNLMIVMALGGLWHGAAWNFVLWGVLHGFALAFWRVIGWNADTAGPIAQSASRVATLLIVLVGWFLFRAESAAQIAAMVGALHNLKWIPFHDVALRTVAGGALALAALETWQRQRADSFAAPDLSMIGRALVYGGMGACVLAMTLQSKVEFIYFQF